MSLRYSIVYISGTIQRLITLTSLSGSRGVPPRYTLPVEMHNQGCRPSCLNAPPHHLELQASVGNDTIHYTKGPRTNQPGWSILRCLRGNQTKPFISRPDLTVETILSYLEQQSLQIAFSRIFLVESRFRIESEVKCAVDRVLSWHCTNLVHPILDYMPSACCNVRSRQHCWPAAVALSGMP